MKFLDQGPISFSIERGWTLVDGLAMEYFIKKEKEPFYIKYVSLLDADTERKIGDVFKFRHSKHKSFVGEQFSFFGLSPVIKTWGDEKCNNCCIGFKNTWWQLNENEGFLYEDLNPDGIIPPPAIIVVVVDNNSQETIKRILIRPKGVQIFKKL